MESLYAEAAACTQGEERVRTLVESIRQQLTDTSMATGRMELATRLAQQAIFELETRAVELDGLLEANTLPTLTPFICQPLATLEALDKQCMKPWDEKLLKDAAREGAVGMVDLLIQAGVDPSANSNSAIQYASLAGQLPVVNRLLQDERVDPSIEDNQAIQYASENGHLAVVNRLLQDERVNPTANNNGAIRQASQKGHPLVIERLLEDERVSSSLNGIRLTFYRFQLSQPQLPQLSRTV